MSRSAKWDKTEFEIASLREDVYWLGSYAPQREQGIPILFKDTGRTLKDTRLPVSV